MTLKLIDRLAKALEPNRDLDCAIAEVFDIGVHYEQGPRWDWIITESSNRLPQYTASIDAALRLVPFEHQVMVQRSVAPDPDCALIGRLSLVYNKSPSCWRGTGSTPAIALCIAALRAKLKTSEGSI